MRIWEQVQWLLLGLRLRLSRVDPEALMCAVIARMDGHHLDNLERAMAEETARSQALSPELLARVRASIHHRRAELDVDRPCAGEGS